jgi:hypothetical protein
MEANELKVTDLMVGDWVICYHPTRLKYFEKVSVGLLHTMQEQEYGHIKENSPLFRIVEPILLTPEILEKNGLANDPYGCHFEEDEYMELEISAEEEGIYWTINYNEYAILKLKYVHQLQHALRLCGINKEIEL